LKTPCNARRTAGHGGPGDRPVIEGDLDLHTFLGLNQGNAGFSGIKAVVHIESDADEAALDALHRKVVSTSPVGHSLTREVPVDVILA